MARALLLTVIGILWMGALGAAPGAAAASVQLRIAEPAAGAVVNAATMPIVLVVEGAGLDTAAATWPYAGEFHIRLDGVDVLRTRALRFTLMGLPPGAHRLGATLEGYATAPIAAVAVAFTAQVVAPPAGATWLLAGLVAAVGAVIVVASVGLWLFWVRPGRAEPLYDPPPDDAQ